MTAKKKKKQTKPKAKPKPEAPRPKMLIDIGKNVRRIRESGGSGCTQEWLASKAKVSRNIVSNIEIGKNYTMKQLVKVVKALSSELDTVLKLDNILEDQRDIHRKLGELLNAGGRYPSSTRGNIEDLHQLYKLERERPPSSGPGDGKPPGANR